MIIKWQNVPGGYDMRILLGDVLLGDLKWGKSLILALNLKLNISLEFYRGSVQSFDVRVHFFHKCFFLHLNK